MSSTDEWHLPPYRLSVADKQKLTSDAIEWINRSGYTPKIYRGLTTFPVPPEKGETAPPQLTWKINLYYLRSPESIDPDEDTTISNDMRLTILNNLKLRKSYTVEVPEGVNLQQFIREHEAEVVDPLMYTWVRTVTPQGLGQPGGGRSTARRHPSPNRAQKP